MAPKLQWTRERVESILDGHLTVKAAAKAAGIKASSLSGYMQNHGIKSPIRTTPGLSRQITTPTISDESLFQAMINHNGKTIAASKELGVTRMTLESRLGRNLELAHRLYLALEKQKKP
jgi:transcriptional regulator of acetoin/glycerol metabolism